MTTPLLTRHVLPGFRPEPLASYLAGLGLIRVLGEQADPNATAAWTPDGLVIATARPDLAQWLVDEYVPTPVLSPWNAGSGFGAKEGADPQNAWDRGSGWRPAACAGHGASCIPPRDQRCSDPGRGRRLALPPGAELVFQPGRRMRLLYRLCLGQQLARLQGVAAACHRRQPQVRDHRVQPPRRPTRGVSPVPTQLRARGAADVVVGHLRQHRGRRAAEDGEAVPDELGSRHPGQAALDKRAVGPGGVRRLEVGQPACIHVHAAQVESLSGPLVKLAVQADQDLLPGRGDRALRQGNQVEITDTGDVIPGGQGTSHQQIGHPAEGG
jgi:hypothetical protein